MGVEVMVFLGRYHEQIGGWFQIDAHVDLKGAGIDLGVGLDKIARHYPKTYFGPPCIRGIDDVCEDQDHDIRSDSYGNDLVAIPVAMLRELMSAVEDVDSERLPMLRALLEVLPKWTTHALIYRY